MSKEEVTATYDFDGRQTDYYTNAAIYLGLVEKLPPRRNNTYKLSDFGKKILQQSFKDRQLSYCRCILSHKVFANTLKICLERGAMSSTEEIIALMKSSMLYKIGSDNTFERRASTIKGWLNWLIGLIEVDA